MPACLSRAPVTRPANPPADERDGHLVGDGFAFDRARRGVVEVMRERSDRLDVLLIAVVAQPLVPLDAVALVDRWDVWGVRARRWCSQLGRYRCRRRGPPPWRSRVVDRRPPLGEPPHEVARCCTGRSGDRDQRAGAFVVVRDPTSDQQRSVGVIGRDRRRDRGQDLAASDRCLIGDRERLVDVVCCDRRRDIALARRTEVWRLQNLAVPGIPSRRAWR